MISPSHLKAHGITGPEYKARFPGMALRIQSEESKRKMSASKAGTVAWNKGISTGPNEKLSKTIAGKPRPNAKGKKRTDEQRATISAATRRGMVGVMTDDVREKIRRSIQNRKDSGTFVAPMTGKTVSEKTRQKIKCSLKVTNDKKSAEIIASFSTMANEQNVIVTRVDDNYWFNFQCTICANHFVFSRQIFRPSTKNGVGLCPTCNPRLSGRSKAEEDFFDFVKQIDAQAIPNDRSVLGGKELDVYLSEKKVAFEFTGLYWHSEKISGAPNHLLHKQQHAFKQGITLYTIFEDEWANKREIVESRIRDILGLTQTKIFARKCEIRNIVSADRIKFLSENHVQGKDSATVAIGLYHDQTLVALASFKKTSISKGGNGGQWELSRFCSKRNTSVVGGASRLIKHFMKAVNTEKLDLISYADRRWSAGNLYKSIGFDFAGTSKPSYWYMSDYKHRKHRSSMMKHTLVKTPEDKSLTEWDLAQRAGYDRIWDCGTTKWVLAYK